MAGAAYILLPITGLFAYFKGGDARTRFHGLQAIALGFVWPLVLIACSKISPGAAQIAFGGGTLVWLAFVLFTFAGKDPRLPLLGKRLEEAAEGSPSEGRPELG
jgi:uncharacterized membrane protein